MLVLTGRQPSELPTHVVRGLVWRAYAERALPLIRAAQVPVPKSAPLQARLDHAELVQLAAEMEAKVFGD